MLCVVLGVVLLVSPALPVAVDVGAAVVLPIVISVLGRKVSEVVAGPFVEVGAALGVFPTEVSTTKEDPRVVG